MLRRCIISVMLVVMGIFSLLLNIYPVMDVSKEKYFVQLTKEYNEEITMLNRQLIRHTHEIDDKYVSFITGKYVINKLPLEINNTLKYSDTLNAFHIPSLYDFLPHLSNSTDSLTPSFLCSKGKQSVSMVLGVPTIERSGTSYLLKTLHSLINRMTPAEKEDVIIIVFIAEWDINYVLKVFNQIKGDFKSELDSGLIEVLSPPKSFYPDLDKLRITLNNPKDRVKWRSKQNLDYAFLMMYAQPKGTFYVQLEDDITPQNGYITTMKKYALQTSRLKEWFVIDFACTGFIGKMIKSVDLSYFINYFIIFFNDKPCDWLLEDISRIMGNNGMEKYIKYDDIIFQHNGKVSSLKSKKGKITRMRRKPKRKKLAMSLGENITYIKQQLQYSQVLKTEYRKKLMLLSQTYDNKLIQNVNSTSSYYLNFLSKLGNSTLFIPTVYDFLPHILLTDSTDISFKMSSNKHIADLVLALLIDKKSNFERFTNVLKDIMKWHKEHNKKQSCTVLIFIAEWDLNYVKKTAMKIKTLYPDEIENGFMEVVSPPWTMYPYAYEADGQGKYKLSQQSKSNLDLAFLMMYAMNKGKLYLQLDEVKRENNLMLGILDNYSHGGKGDYKIEPVLDFSGNGFKAKLFRTDTLPFLIQQLIMFYKNKSSEELLKNHLETRYCRNDDKKCKNKREIISFSNQKK
ncbi:unnamed protein product [Meganyctiphanes norvegica]|uniref:MGAT4 conserved region domain-containing protein n=1 Tax=Meganyctiphanes norvegica TaxID=48144 RepID=A0AAV2S0Z6_MEGNR